MCAFLAGCGGTNTTPAPFGMHGAKTRNQNRLRPFDVTLSGTVYVAVKDGNKVVAYSPYGGIGSLPTITDGIAAPVSLAVDSTNRLFVANLNNVTEYDESSTSNNKTAKIASYSNGSHPLVLGADHNDSLWVAYANDTVVQYRKGTSPQGAAILIATGLSFPIGTGTPVGMAFGPSGNSICVLTASPPSVFCNNTTTGVRSRTITAGLSGGSPTALAFDPNSSRLWVTLKATNSVVSYDSGSTTPNTTAGPVTLHINAPTALAFDNLDPTVGGSLWVANSGTYNISWYDPTGVYEDRYTQNATDYGGMVAMASGPVVNGTTYIAIVGNKLNVTEITPLGASPTPQPSGIMFKWPSRALLPQDISGTPSAVAIGSN